MTIAFVINKLQQINDEVTGIESAPQLDNYPSAIDTFQTSIVLTEKEDGSFRGQNDNNDATDQYVIRALLDTIGQGNKGYKMEQAYRLLDAFRTKYLDPATYQALDPDGNYVAAYMPVLRLEDPRIQIDPASFNDTGLISVEYPEGSGRVYYPAFEVRLSVKTIWEWDCD